MARVLFVLPAHDNTPSGGRKIIYSYANELGKEGNSVEIRFVMDTRFPGRKHTNLATVKHTLQFLTSRKRQLEISWFEFDKNVKLTVGLLTSDIDVTRYDKVILFYFAIALGISRLEENKDKFIYFIQADEKIYYDQKFIDRAWSLPIKKLVVSEWLRTLVEQRDSNVSVVNNYVDETQFYLTKPIEGRTPTISMINHPSASKRSEFGFQVIGKLKKIYPQLKVVIFGNTERPKNLGFDFTYYEKASESTLRDKVYNESTIFLFPSLSEGWGMVASEAMASGAVVVAADNGGIQDFVEDGVNGLIVNDNTTDAYVLAISSLLLNESLRLQYARKGIEVMREFSFDNSFRDFKGFLK